MVECFAMFDSLARVLIFLTCSVSRVSNSTHLFLTRSFCFCSYYVYLAFLCMYFAILNSMFYPSKAVDRQPKAPVLFWIFFGQQKLLLFLSVLKSFQLFCVAWLSNLFRYSENNVINCLEVKGGVWSSHCTVKWSDTQLPKTCRRNMGRLRQKIRLKALIAWSFLGNLNIFVNFKNIIKRSDSPNISISCCSVRPVLQKLIWGPWRDVFLMNNNYKIGRLCRLVLVQLLFELRFLQGLQLILNLESR